MKSLASIIIIIIFSAAAFAQEAGDLDNTFGGDGKVTDWFPYGGIWGGVSNMAIQPDGKILVAGTYQYSLLYWDCFVSRYNTDGSIDNSFGGSGTIITGSETSCVVFALSVQQDLKIVVGQYLDPYYSVTRFNQDGSYDTSFTPDSYIASSLTEFPFAIQSDGKIVAGGSGFGPNNDFTLSRYNNDGTLDSTFNSTGFVTTSIDSGSCIVSLAIQSDGKIVAAGFANSGIYQELALARYNPNGSLDSNFNQDGIVTTPIDSIKGLSAIVLQADGKILAYCNLDYYSDHHLTLVRFNTTGSLDTTFGGNGVVSIYSFKYASSFALQADGKIVAAGTTPNYDFTLICLNNNGSVDTSFGSYGMTTTDIDNSNDKASCIGIQPDRKIVLAGNAGSQIGLARYLSGLNVGIINFSSSQSPLIYPNPIHLTETLEYTLTKNESLTINLYDVNGILIKNFISNEQRTAGNHKETLNIGELPSGNYFLTLTNGSQKMTVKLVKQQ